MSAILKQKLIDIANGFTKYGLWKGGGSVSAKIDMLWENPSPSTSFSEQNVTIDTNYDIFIIDFIPNYNSLFHFTMLFNKVFNRKYVLYCNSGGSQSEQYQRRFTLQDNYINFEGGLIPGIKYDNSVCIPTFVYGIKFKNEIHEYSTEEKIVGKWIDGKDIFERVMVLENFIVNANSWYTTNIIFNFEKTLKCYLITEDGIAYPSIASQNNGKLSVRHFRNDNIAFNTIIIQYTKTE